MYIFKVSKEVRKIDVDTYKVPFNNIFTAVCCFKNASIKN